MIPLRLELKNFLPYRSPLPLSFDGIHLACLTGSNGAGKSSLLDAITWALWGKARGVRDDDLIHQGQGEMSVILDFEQEGRVYRVIRQRSGGKSGKGRLDLLVLQDDGYWRAINGDTMRATQEVINSILRLDYETFTNSAFLQQGKADAFTTQTPAQRKKILSDILGLEQWRVYEERAKARQKEIERQINENTGRIHQIDEDLRQRPALEQAHREAEHACQSAETAFSEAETRFNQLSHVPDDLRRARERHAEHTDRLASLTHDLADAQARHEAHQRRLAEYLAVIDQREAILAGVQALDEARALDASLSEKLEHLGRLRDERQRLEKELTAIQAEMKAESKNLAKDIARYRQLIAEDPAEALAQVEAELAAMTAIQAQRDELASQEQSLKDARAEQSARRNALTEEGMQLNERIDMLQKTDAPLCPLCGQPLDEQRRAALVAEITAERDARREDWRACDDALKALDADLKALSRDLKALDKELKRLPELSAQAGDLRNRAQTATDARHSLDEALRAQAEIDRQLNDETFGADQRRQLARLAHQVEALGYDETTHKDARLTLNDQRNVLDRQTRLKIAEDELPAQQAALENEQARIARLVAAIDEQKARLDELTAEMAALAAQQDEYNRRWQELSDRATARTNAYERLRTLAQSLSALDVQEKRKAQIELVLHQLRHQDAVYDELARAFGKNGIPAMIIETAIPELEATANELLSRMTDGRMSLRLITQRDNKTGGLRETLDIQIADELGTRDYELYSGGEAFRVNFALRVALSQLLARRAGAHLRTLFIDEGFGTQDDDGRNKLVEAINAIQSYFDMILVITHIDELRDSFPVHIVVEKTGEGSRVSVR